MNPQAMLECFIWRKFFMAKFLDKIDSKAEQKGKLVKILWQFFKFLIVSCTATIIQLVLVNVLHRAMKGITSPITGFLGNIFTEQTMGAGNTNWGYILPWFLSNLLANIYGYIQNKLTTFKSDSPWWCMMIYLVLIVALILFSTWLQGLVFHACEASQLKGLIKFGPTIAAMSAGTLQFAVLFPVEKFVLLRERKSSDNAPEDSEENFQ